MSYDITLNDPVTKKTIEINTPHFIQGGTFALNGTKELWLNVTWNYADYYYGVCEEGIRTIYGKTGLESIPILEKMIEDISNKYGTETDNDYWKATPGNAIKPLYQLIAFAKMRPDGIWEGD